MKKIIIICVFAVLSIIILFFLIQQPKPLSQKQKIEAITTMLGRQPILTDKSSEKGDTLYKGKTVSVYYPKRAKIYVLKVNGKLQKDNWNLDNLNFDLDDPRLTALVTVSSAGDSVKEVGDYPSVRLRQIQPGMYKQGNIEVDGNRGLSFEKEDNTGFEKTAFFYFKQRIYFFSTIGSDKKGVLEIFNKMTSTAKFF